MYIQKIWSNEQSVVHLSGRMYGESPAGVTTAADARDLAEAGIALAAA